MTELIPFIKAYLVYIGIGAAVILAAWIFFVVLLARHFLNLKNEVEKSFKSADERIEEMQKRHEERRRELEKKWNE